MASTYKILGQASPDNQVVTSLYSCPVGTQTIVSTINICNRSLISTTFRIIVRPSDITLSNRHYIAYDTNISGNDIITLTLGITLKSQEVIEVYSDRKDLSFNCFGVEIT